MTFSHKSFSPKFSATVNRAVCAALLGGVLALAAPASAAETWLLCEGTVTGGEGGPAPVKETYAYNDDTKFLYKYSEKRKSLDPVLVRVYDAKQITWASTSTGSNTASWEGKLDRTTMAITQSRKDGTESLTWAQTCKPTKPL